MLTRVFASLFALCLVFLATPLLASAQAAAANGNYKFVMEDGLTKYLEFDARSDDKGTTTGYMIFNDETPIIFQDVDGNGDKGDEPLPFTMKADLDSMTVEKNRALISGVIRDSNYPGYIGKWVQLVIEDNDGIEVPDKFVWQVCQPDLGGWIPQDAEVPDDRGAYMSWWSTDFERKDDVGIPSPNLIPGTLKICRTYALGSYEFATIGKGDGVIQISQ
jgi:hypothetical protein